MSLWNNFKKKLEDTWESADFWDKTENAQQKQARTQSLQPTPTQSGPSISVEQPRQTSTISFEQPRQQPTISVAPQQDFSNKFKIDIGNSVTNPVDAGLNAGKSWEQIAKETGADVEKVKEYSQATRPNYGITMKKPEQSFGNKVVDLIDANTESDKYRRYQANEKAVRDGNERDVVAVTAVNPGNLVTNTVGAIPRMANTLAVQATEVGYTAQQQFATAEYTAASEAYREARKTGNPTVIKYASDRVDAAINRLDNINAGIDATKSSYSNGGGLFNAGTLYNEEDSRKGDLATGARRIGGGTAEGMLDAASFGLVGLGGKQIVKQGFKQALKNSKGLLAKNATVNITQGAASEYRQGGDVGDIVQSALISGAAGTAGDIALAGGGAVLTAGGKKARNKIVDMLNTTSSKDAGTVIHLPNEGVYARITPEQADVLKDEVNRIPWTPEDKPHLTAGGLVREQAREVTQEEISRLSGNADKALTGDVAPQPILKPITPEEKLQLDYLNTKAKQELLPDDERDMLNDLAGRYTTSGIVEPPKVQAEVDPRLQGARMPKAGTVKPISDLMDIGRFGKAATEDVDEMLAKKNGITADTVRRLRDGYGEEKMQSILQRNSDAVLDTPGRANDKNAFIISQARNEFGSPNVRISRMSPEEEASLLGTAPPVRNAPQTADDFAPDYEQAKMDNFQPDMPQTAEFPVRTVDPDTGEVVTTFETRPLNSGTPPIREVPPVDAPESQLGKIVETFYDNSKGDVKIGYRALKELGKSVSKQINTDLTAIGSNFNDIARKIQEGARNGIETLEAAGLSPAEAQIIRKAQTEMNYIRRRASLGGKKVNDKSYGEMYLPNQKLGQYSGARLFEGFRDTNPGSELKRQNKIDLEDLDYSADVVGQYITRYGDTKAYRTERIFNALKNNNPTTDDELLTAAATRVVALQDKINDLKKKISVAGFGSRKIVAQGEEIDTVGEFNDIGKMIGKTQIDVVDAPKGLTNGDKINSVSIGDKTLADHLGLNQYRDAQNYTAKQILDAGGDRTKLVAMVQERLTTDYNLPQDTIDYIVGGLTRMSADLPDEVINARVLSSYKIAAKQQLLEQLQGVNITNPKLKKTISDLTNQILREGTIEQQASSKIVSKVLQTTNAIFRKFNLSSAINELSDLPSFVERYGVNTKLTPDFKKIKEFGLGSIDAALDPYIKQIEAGNSLKSVLLGINDFTNLYKFVEHYKTAVMADSASKFYSAQGLTGDALTKRVLSDYRDMALPVDAFTKTFLDNYPLYTQYMSWGARNLQKEGKLASGKMAGGKLDDLSQRERIARYAYANLPAKTVFWLASNGLKGTAILTAFGLTDFTGLSNQDYSGIEEEDKSLFDKTTQVTNGSTTFSLLNSIVQAIEKEQLKNSDKYKDAKYNPYENTDADKEIMRTFTPQVAKNVQGGEELRTKGYSENASGKVQYEAPDDVWNWIKAYTFGKGNTEKGREYSGRENLEDRVDEGKNPLIAIADMAKEQLGLQDTDYTRPLNKTYSDKYKSTNKVNEDARTALLEGGRKYNGYLEDLQKNNPDAYNGYIASMDGNHVSPEYWKEIIGGDSGKSDLATFNMIKDRKKQAAKDLGTGYDPIYDLTDEQAKSVLQQKSVATGDDIALRNALYKEQWYNDYMAKTKEYYDAKSETDSDYEQTKRVKDWYGYNDQYNALHKIEQVDGKDPEWATQFPTVFQQKLVNNTYGFDSEQSKNFFKTYGDAYAAEKVEYDKANLTIINKMREIEGYPPMSEEQYAQVTNIKNTDDKKTAKKYNNNYGSGLSRNASFGSMRELALPSVKIKVPTVKINRSTKTKGIKVTKNKKVSRA